jgi:hypothetical protein
MMQGGVSVAVLSLIRSCSSGNKHLNTTVVQAAALLVSDPISVTEYPYQYSRRSLYDQLNILRKKTILSLTYHTVRGIASLLL